MLFWVSVFKDARFVSARSDSKAWSCQAELSEGVKRERRGRMADEAGRLDVKMWCGSVEMRIRERACAAVDCAEVAAEGDEKVRVFVGTGEDAVLEMWSQIVMSSFTAPCWARAPL